MDDCRLILPSTQLVDEISAYRKAFLDTGDSMDGCGSLRRHGDPQEWLEFNALLSDSATMPAGMVPSTQFVYLREQDQKIVGMLQIRHWFNDYLERYGGHIGYSVRPDERRKGYAKRMLAEALPKCRELGLNRVLITCLEDNEASRRTILASGGVYEATVYEPEENVRLQRYWISLEER